MKRVILTLLLLPVPVTLAQSSPPPGTFTLSTAPSPTLVAIKALLTGSRWNYFEGPDVKGKVYWVEFYRDGKMYSGWGEAFKWELIEPSTIHMTSLKNKNELYLEVDLAKKEARPDPKNPTKFHNSMSFQKRVSASPPKGVKF